MTDDEAVRALREGDKDALNTLIQRYELRAVRLAYHITRDSESAKDVVADSFLAVVEQIGRSDPDRPFEPWFFRIVTNRAISVTRWASRRQRLLSLIVPRHEPADPEAEAIRNEPTELSPRLSSRCRQRSGPRWPSVTTSIWTSAGSPRCSGGPWAR